jgi:hypothetical protein
MYLISLYEDWTLKPLKIILCTGRGVREDNSGWTEPRYIVSIYENVTMKPPVKLKYALKIL